MGVEGDIFFLALVAGTAVIALASALVFGLLYLREKRLGLRRTGRLTLDLELLSKQHRNTKKSEEHYKSLLAVQGNIVFRKDPGGSLTYVNKVFCDTFGLSPIEALGTSFVPEPAEEETLPFADDLSRILLQPRRACYDQHVLTVHGPRWIAWEDFAVRDPDGNVTEIQTVGYDIADRKETEKRLKAALGAAEEANHAKSAFLASMSHEIRTPMNAMLGMTQLLLDTSLTPAQQSYTQAVKQSGQALLAIINDILDYSKIEAEKIVLNKEPFSPGALIETVTELLAARAFEKKIDIAACCAPDMPALVRGDEHRLRQILLNLAGNAVKFTDKGGVQISASCIEKTGLTGRDTLHIEVEDTGIGMPAEEIGHIFGEFNQARSGEFRKAEGTGLGLAIARRLVEAMGGRIEVTSAQGEGSTFSFSVEVDFLEATDFRNKKPLDGQKVLVGCSAPMTRRSLVSLLKEMGARVEIVATVPELNTRLAARDSDVCILCEDMTGTGFQPPARHEGAPGPKIILLTEPGARVPDFFDGYLVRPLRARSVLRRLTQTEMQTFSHTIPAPKIQESGKMPLQILVAEDNELNAILTRTLLERSGHRVVLAQNGSQALDFVSGSEPDTFDIILMDLRMPGMDGFEATKHIRALEAPRAAIPIIALTANAMVEDRQACLDGGMDDYLAKPVSGTDLDAVLELWRDRRSNRSAV